MTHKDKGQEIDPYPAYLTTNKQTKKNQGIDSQTLIHLLCLIFSFMEFVTPSSTIASILASHFFTKTLQSYYNNVTENISQFFFLICLPHGAEKSEKILSLVLTVLACWLHYIYYANIKLVQGVGGGNE